MTFLLQFIWMVCSMFSAHLLLLIVEFFQFDFSRKIPIAQPAQSGSATVWDLWNKF